MSKNNPMVGMRDMMKSMFHVPLSMAEMGTRGMSRMVGASEKDETAAKDMLDSFFNTGERIVDNSVDMVFAPLTGEMPDWSDLFVQKDSDEDKAADS